MPKRECGSCTACCTLMQVPELPKPAGVSCGNLCGKGCGIYEKRPGSCKAFQCLWLSGDIDIEGDPEFMRPDKFGLMFSPMYGTAFGDLMAAWEVWPGASREAGPRQIIESLSANESLILMKQGNRTIVGPPHEVDRVHRIMEEINTREGLPVPPKPRIRRIGGGQELFPR